MTGPDFYFAKPTRKKHGLDTSLKDFAPRQRWHTIKLDDTKMSFECFIRLGYDCQYKAAAMAKTGIPQYNQ